MKGKRRAAAAVLTRTGLAAWLRPFARDRLIVLNYHRLCPDDGGGERAFDAGVFGPTRAEFRAQVAFFRRRFRMLVEDELVALLASGGRGRGRGPWAMITFDDAYRDVRALAWPVLRDLGVPALLFVPTGLVDRREVGWWDLIAWFARRTGKAVLRAGGEEFAVGTDREGLARRLQARAKTLDGAGLSAFCGELEASTAVGRPPAAEQEAQLLAWDDIRFLRRNGMAVGSHTLNHPVLSRLDPEEQRRELADSRARLEAETGGPVRSVAYPVGAGEHFGEATKAAAREAGYALGFSFTCEVNRLGRTDPYAVSRCECSDGMRAAYAKCLLPGLFAG